MRKNKNVGKERRKYLKYVEKVFVVGGREGGRGREFLFRGNLINPLKMSINSEKGF